MDDTKIVTNALCPFCFSPLGKAAKCAVCGKTAKKYKPPTGALPPFSTLKNRYVLGATLGTGGFGITYNGLDRLSGARVAVKEYFPSNAVRRGANGRVEPDSADARVKFLLGKKRFSSEARNMAEVRNMRGITEVLDFFSENDTAYIVMEYIDGETLESFLLKNRKLPFERALTLMTPVLEALGRLHEAGFVHGDVSPDNIMLTESGCKLLDFGSVVHADVFDGARAVTLKKHYAPPEQYNSGMVLGAEADVYSAGVTLYYCVCGSLPPESVSREVRDDIKLPSRYGAKISETEERALMKSIAVVQTDRYADMHSMIAALTAAAKSTKGINGK